MIQSFKDKEAERVFNRLYSSRLPTELQRIAFRKLHMLHRAQILNDLKVFPGNRLEKLKGDRAGLYSIRINDQWRICFEWINGDAYEVEIVDYH